MLARLAFLSLVVPMLAACSSGTLTATPAGSASSATKSPASNIFVEHGGTFNPAAPTPTSQSHVLEFPASSTGMSSALVDLSSSTNYVLSVAVDPQGNLYVGKLLNGSAGSPSSAFVDIYGPDLSSASIPMRTIKLPIVAIPASLFVDASGQLYVLVITATTGIIYVYPPGAGGSDVPARTIAGNATMMTPNQTFSLSLDPSGDIYVGSFKPSEVLVFSSSANGNVAPSRVISFSSGNVWGVANDSQGNLYASVNTQTTNLDGKPSRTATIQVFAPGASGAATPIRTIAGSATTFSYVSGMRTDAEDNLWALNNTMDSTGPETYYTNHILEFPAGATGNVAPEREFHSSQWATGGEEIAVQ